MKTLIIFPMLAVAGAVISAPCAATVVATSTLEQPVNLGTRSDPARIPLGPVPVVSNHGYGIHAMIGAARPCPDGAMRWEGGSELDQNLASVFGISVEAQDPTQILAFPVTLRVKPWKPPAYSPHTKEQVLAATLWCLIRSAGGTPETPLDVRVVAESADDKPLEAKYSGKYATTPGKDGKEVPPARVPGTVVTEDARGIAWVSFPGETRKSPPDPPTPGMIIHASEGDGDEGWHVLPVWGNGNGKDDFLRLNGWAATMGYSSYRARGVTNANAFHAAGGAEDFTVEPGGNSIVISHPRVEPDILAADILALIVAAQPTDARPLRVSIAVEKSSPPTYSAFSESAGWKETTPENPNSSTSTLECEFVWNAAEKQLAKGTVPLVRMPRPGWIERNPEP